MLKAFVYSSKPVTLHAILLVVLCIASSAFLPLAQAQNATLEVPAATNSTTGDLPLPVQSGKQPQNRDAKGTDVTQNSGIDLVIKSFLLSQGEDGSTLWRLKAISGTMHKESDVVVIDQPALVYYLPPDDEELFVSSARGEVRQAQKHIRFLEQVVLTHNNSIITSEELIYDGNTRTMTIPQEGLLEGSKMSGRADLMIWHLDTRILECIGSVEAVFVSHDDPLVQLEEGVTPSDATEKED